MKATAERICVTLHWTTIPSGLPETEPGDLFNAVDGSWAKSKVFSVPRNGEVSIAVTLDKRIGDPYKLTFFRVYCENAKSKTYTFDFKGMSRLYFGTVP
jgi:hypothetical protein